MKNILKIISFSLILIVSTSLNAQDNSKKKTDELLIGTWQFDFNKSIDSISSSSKKKYDRINNETQDKIKKLYSQRKLSFLSDGQLILELTPEVQRRGIWKLLNDKKSLYVKMDDGRELNQTVEKINASSLRLNLGGNQSKDDKRLFHKWYLNRINP